MGFKQSHLVCHKAWDAYISQFSLPQFRLTLPPHKPSMPQLRGQSNPFIAAYEGSRSRAQRSRSSQLGGLGRLSSSGVLGQPVAWSSSDAGEASASDLAAAANGGASSAAAASSALLAAMAAMDLPQPTPALPAEVAVERIHYAPAARMLAVVLADGRCALCRTADSGIHPVEQLQLFRWAYKPAGPAAPAAVSAALNPSAQLLAMGLSHGRVAIYTMQSLLATGRHPGLAAHQRSSSGQLGVTAGSGSGGAGQPEPVRVLSLADWGYSSSVVGAASQLQWSPDGRVLAVGYAERGMAVWTPSGCRLMCSLRQAIATSAPATSNAALAGAAPSAQAAAATPTPPERRAERPSVVGGSGGVAKERCSSTESMGAAPAGSGGLWSQSSNLNPGQAAEPGVLEVRVGVAAGGAGTCSAGWTG